MKYRAPLDRIRMGAITLIAGLALSGAAMAQGHSGAGGHVGGFSGGHVGGFGGGHVGGFHGYGGWRGGYGYRGGWYGGGGWGWGWGWPLAYGLYFGALPLWYSTWYWDGVPYYYANGNYYQYNAPIGQYETVRPPAGLEGEVGAAQPPASTELFAYPKNGQTTQQQATDRFECHRWAAGQTGFDPTQGGSTAGSAPSAGGSANAAPPPSAAPPAGVASMGKRQDYMRAQAACLEGRGYSVQ